METNQDYLDVILSERSKNKPIIEYIELEELENNTTRNNQLLSEQESLLSNNSNIRNLPLFSIITKKDLCYLVIGLVIVISFLTILYLYLYDKV